jgi:hypothetical protein
LDGRINAEVLALAKAVEALGIDLPMGIMLSANGVIE